MTLSEVSKGEIEKLNILNKLVSKPYFIRHQESKKKKCPVFGPDKVRPPVTPDVGYV